MVFVNFSIINPLHINVSDKKLDTFFIFIKNWEVVHIKQFMNGQNKIFSLHSKKPKTKTNFDIFLECKEKGLRSEDQLYNLKRSFDKLFTNHNFTPKQ